MLVGWARRPGGEEREPGSMAAVPRAYNPRPMTIGARAGAIGFGPATCVRGRFRPGGSKSLAQRALLMAAAAEGTSEIDGLAEGEGEDVRAALALVEAAGGTPGGDAGRARGGGGIGHAGAPRDRVARARERPGLALDDRGQRLAALQEERASLRGAARSRGRTPAPEPSGHLAGRARG